MTRLVFASIPVLSLAILLFSYGADAKECGLYGALYEPKASSPQGERLVLEITKPPKDDDSTSRMAYFTFTLFQNGGDKASDVRLAYGCSNGASICRASAYFGQYTALNDLKEFKSTLTLDVVPLRTDFEIMRNFIHENSAPDALIFPNISSAFLYEDKGNFPNYTRFYGDNTIIPDLSGKDVWILSNCVGE